MHRHAHIGRRTALVAGILLVMLSATACAPVPFSGHVYRGALDDTSQPLAGVQVQLYGAIADEQPGMYIYGTVTDASGAFTVRAPVVLPTCHLVVLPPPGYSCSGARSGPWGRVVHKNMIAFPLLDHVVLLPGIPVPPDIPELEFPGNSFFLEGAPPVPAPPSFDFYYILTGYTGVQDTSLDRWDPDGNLARKSIYVRSGAVKVGLLRYELAPYIRSDSLVRSATLRLRVLARSNPSRIWVGAYLVLRPWTDVEATWTQATSTDLWAAPGCQDTAVDRLADAAGVARLPAAEDEYVIIDVTSLVQQWVKDPASNKGLYLGGLSDSASEVILASSEHPVPEWRPRLTVFWENAGSGGQ